MVTERESMTLNEVGARALGVEERSDETPRARASGAKPAPDPEVVAKPKRRQFTAEYRLRILEEADRCVQPGEVGRLLRREGLYTSHLAAWRKARRQGSLRGLTPSKRGARPAERNPLSAKVRELEAKVVRLEKELHTAHTILEVQGKVAGLLGFNLSDGRIADGGPRARLTGRCGPSVPSAGRVTGHLLPSSQGHSRAPAAPSNARPGAVRVRTRACAQRARLPSLRRPRARRGRRHAAR